MLNRDEANYAIQLLYEDFESQIGNPVPFVRTYNEDSIDEFNRLCVKDGVAIGMFYGKITWNIANKTVDTDPNIVCQYYINPTLLIESRFSLNVFKTLAGSPDVKLSETGTTQGIFVQNLFIEQDASVDFDGYIFGIKTP